MRTGRNSAARRAGVAAPIAALAGCCLLAAGCRVLRSPRQLAVALDRVATLDPQHHNEVVSWSLLCNFYDALVRFSPEMRLEPSLAVAWRQVDATHVRFELRPGVRFSDGARFGSADVVATVDRALRDPQSMIRHYLLGVRRVVADGDSAVVVETTGPAPTLVNRLAFLFVVPRAQAALPEITAPVGTGPYRFLAREADGAVVAEGWAGWRGAPRISKVRFAFVEDEDLRSRRFAAGDYDVSVRVNDDLVDELKDRSGLRLRPQPSLLVQLLVVNPAGAAGEARQALADPRVRRALLLAINRGGLADRVFRGNGSVATQYVHPVIVGFDPGVSALPYDPAEARRLLGAAGYPAGFAVDLAHGAIPPAYVAGLVADLERIGVRVRPVQFSLRELVRRSHAGEFPLMTYARACTTGDASEFLDSSIHTPDASHGLGLENFSGYSDPATDALLEAADRELEPGKRLELLQQAQRRVLETLPILPLTLRTEYTGVSSRVEVTTRFDGWVWVAGYRWDRP